MPYLSPVTSLRFALLLFYHNGRTFSSRQTVCLQKENKRARKMRILQILGSFAVFIQNHSVKAFAELFSKSDHSSSFLNLRLSIRSPASSSVARQKQLSVVFGEAKPPKARSRQSRRLAEAIGGDYATVAFSPVGRAVGFIKVCRTFLKNHSGMWRSW